MALVVLIENPEKLDDYVEQDMRRWWQHRCRKIVSGGKTYFIVPGKFYLYEGVKRLASFGVKARVARLNHVSSPSYL